MLLAIPAIAEWRKIEVIPEADEADSLKATRYGTRLGRLSPWIKVLFCKHEDLSSIPGSHAFQIMKVWW